MTRFAAAAVVVSGLVGVVNVTPAFAQGKPGAGRPLSDKEKKDGARKAYKEGERLLKLGKHKEAYEHYRVADDLLPIAATKYKMALCLDKQGKILEAAAAYQLFFDAAPAPEKFADAIADARTRLDLLKRTPGRIKLLIEPSNPPNLGVQVDGGPVYGPPPDRVLALPPGHHRVTATAPGYDAASADLDLSFAEGRDLRLVMPPIGRMAPPPPPPPIAVVVGPRGPAPLPPPPPPPSRGPSHVASYVLYGVAGAGAIVGVVFGVQALGAKSDFNKAPTKGNADREQLDARIADAALFSALGLAVVGTVLLFVPRSASTTALSGPATHASVAPYVGPQGVGFTF